VKLIGATIQQQNSDIHFAMLNCMKQWRLKKIKKYNNENLLFFRYLIGVDDGNYHLIDIDGIDESSLLQQVRYQRWMTI